MYIGIAQIPRIQFNKLFSFVYGKIDIISLFGNNLCPYISLKSNKFKMNQNKKMNHSISQMEKDHIIKQIHLFS